MTRKLFYQENKMEKLFENVKIDNIQRYLKAINLYKKIKQKSQYHLQLQKNFHKN